MTFEIKIGDGPLTFILMLKSYMWWWSLEIEIGAEPGPKAIFE